MCASHISSVQNAPCLHGAHYCGKCHFILFSDNCQPSNQKATVI